MGPFDKSATSMSLAVSFVFVDEAKCEGFGAADILGVSSLVFLPRIREGRLFSPEDCQGVIHALLSFRIR